MILKRVGINLLCSSLACSTLLVAQEDPALHFSLSGIADLSTVIEASDPRVVIAGVARAGDFDGDGRDDLLLRLGSDPEAPIPVQEVVTLLYGPLNPPSLIDVSNGEIRKSIIPTGPSDEFGELVGLAGGEDFDGDGSPDILVASSFEPSVQGPAILLILRSEDGLGLPPYVDVGRIGSEILGSLIVDDNPSNPAQLGQVVALIPDVNGDGRGEVLLGEAASIFDRKKAYLLFGSEGLPRLIFLDEIGTAIPGSILEVGGAPGERGIRRVRSLGDVDGDGLSEIGVLVSNLRGAADGGFLLFGRENFPERVALDDLPAELGVQLPGYEDISSAGDVNGDGKDEIILVHIPNGLGNGEAQIFYGRKRTEIPTIIDHQTFVSDGLGTVISERQDFTGQDGFGTPTPRLTFAPGKDIDGDGKAELFFSASQRNVSYGRIATLQSAGTFFLISGSEALPERISTDDIARLHGLRVDGGRGFDMFGEMLEVLDDFNGDGSRDLLLTSRFEPCARDPFLNDVNRRVWIIPRGVLNPRIRPQIKRIHPERGSTDGGNQVVVFGTGLSDEPRAFFGDSQGEIEEVLGPGILLVKVPPAEVPQRVPVRIMTGAGESAGDVTYEYQRVNKVSIGPSNKDRVLTFSHRKPNAYLSRGMAAGDFNGDGFVDMAMLNWLGSTVDSELVIVFGTGGRGDDVDLDSLSPPSGSITVFPSTDLRIDRLYGGAGISAGGDLNQDGFDDLILKVTQLKDRIKEWWVILGRKDYPRKSTLFAMSETIRFVGGEADSGAGIVPDVSGDGIDDLLLTTRARDSRSLYVVKGRREFPQGVFLDSLTDRGFGARYVTNLRVSDVAGSAGDFNSDGHSDVFFAGRGRFGEGSVVVLYGGPEMFPNRRVILDSKLFGDSGGLLISGQSLLTGRDFWVTVPGDLDGDGDPELFLRQDNTFICSFIPRSGKGYIFDRETILREGFVPEEFPIVTELYSAGGTGLPDFAPLPSSQQEQQGVTLVQGANRGEVMGVPASPAGDFNADGYADLLIGGQGGNAYVLLGGPDFFSRPLIDLSKSADHVIILAGQGSEGFGRSVGGGFDWDRDGIDDVFIGGREGRVHLILGAPIVESNFLRGDADGNLQVNLTDPIVVLNYLFLGGQRQRCLDALDADDDGDVVLTDAVYLLVYLFLGGPSPPEPFAMGGVDPTPDQLICSP